MNKMNEKTSVKSIVLQKGENNNIFPEEVCTSTDYF